MSRRKRPWNAPKSLTPRRAFDLLVELYRSDFTEVHRLRLAREALQEHVKAGLERAARRPRPKAKASVVRLAGKVA